MGENVEYEQPYCWSLTASSVVGKIPRTLRNRSRTSPSIKAPPHTVIFFSFATLNERGIIQWSQTYVTPIAGELFEMDPVQ